ncbi:hypothetical protein KJ693_09680 [bacterium]|nr:hypothetical protein [bacterium]MBU1615563.1 hypothetical protein [bacterium]
MLKEEVKSILVIRSAPLARTFEALKKLREEYPNAEISVLVQPEVKDEIEKTCPRLRSGSGFADKVIVGIKRGRISLFKHLSLVFRLRKKVVDLVAIIYNTEDISWYGNLRLFAFAREGVFENKYTVPISRIEGQVDKKPGFLSLAKCYRT